MIPFIRRYPALLAFGIVTAAFSGPGQTYLVSLFIPSMRGEFGMSQTEIAGVYSLATLVSALILPLTGRLLDRLHLARFTFWAGILLAAGCVLLGQGKGIAAVFLGFLLVRNLGQGTMTMISSTTMARIFGTMRGKALGIANLGYPIGEAIFPLIVSSWILVYGWRSGWMFLTGLVLFLFLPTVVWLLARDPHKRAQEDIARQNVTLSGHETRSLQTRSWSLAQMFRDRRFYFLLLPVLIPPAFFTALFFHQVTLMEWKGWGVQLIGAGFVAFGTTRAAISFWVGPWVDRLSARKIYPLNLIPLALGLLCFAFGTQGFWVFIYLGLAGMTMGISMTASSALWAEFYGTRHLGSIRGMLSLLVVLSTAVAPIVMGALLDARVRPIGILMGMIFVIIAGTVSAWIACRKGAMSN